MKLEPRCFICGSTHDVQVAPKWLTGLGRPWCFECFEAWYDYGKTDLEEVRAKSLELQKEQNKGELKI